MIQLAMTLARRTDPATSKDAAARVDTFRAKHEATIYAALSEFSGCTYREIADLTGLEPVAVARRLSAMERRGLITRHAVDDNLYEARDNMALWWRV